MDAESKQRKQYRDIRRKFAKAIIDNLNPPIRANRTQMIAHLAIELDVSIHVALRVICELEVEGSL